MPADMVNRFQQFLGLVRLIKLSGRGAIHSFYSIRLAVHQVAKRLLFSLSSMVFTQARPRLWTLQIELPTIIFPMDASLMLLMQRTRMSFIFLRA
jgi:hypothetical protein